MEPKFHQVCLKIFLDFINIDLDLVCQRKHILCYNSDLIRFLKPCFQVDIIYIDFSKTFNTENHSILIIRLKM